MNEVTVWLHALMVAFAPPEKYAQTQASPGWEETASQRSDRYRDIASELQAYVYEPDTKPLFQGAKGRARTAALILAIAYHESGFAIDVDKGPCYRGKYGNGMRCDEGRSACLLQIRVGSGTSIEGFTKAELFAERKKCFQAGLNLVRRSMAACRALPQEHRLNSYASGTCGGGHKASERLWRLYERFFAKLAPPG